MSVPTEQITEKRMKLWAFRLSQQHSTPLLMLGMGHDETSGQLTVITVDDVDDRILLAALEYAVQQLKSRN